MKTAVFHSVNSGLFFWGAGEGLLVDGIHEGRAEGCSPMPEFLDMQLRRGTGLFAHLTGALFTHLHHDHFDRGRLELLLRKQPGLLVYGPDLQYGPVAVRPIRPRQSTLRMGCCNILAQDTPHDGARFRGSPHQSYLIRMAGESFLVAGDGVLTGEDGQRFAQFYGAPVTAGFFNLYQLASAEGQDFLRALAPERVFLYHLPFPGDDRYHYHQLAHYILKNWPADLPQVEILTHMAWVDGRLAEWEMGTKGENWNDLSGIAQYGPLF